MHAHAVADGEYPSNYVYHLHAPRQHDGKPLRSKIILSISLVMAAFTGAAATAIALGGPQKSSFSRLSADVADESDGDEGVLAHCNAHSKRIKRTVCMMDHALVGLGSMWQDWTTFSNAMQPFWGDDFMYRPMYGMNESHGLRSWFHNEMSTWTLAFPTVEFNQLIFIGSGVNASSTTYAVGNWEAPLGPLAPTGSRMTVRITDFYAGTEDDRIARNYMMIDMLDLLRQRGVAPLPLSPLPQGRVSPPCGNSIPAPLARYVIEPDADAHKAHKVVSAMLNAEWMGSSIDLVHWHRSDMIWYGPVPFGMAVGSTQYVEHFLRPLHAAFAADSRALSIDVFACEGQYCAVHGTFRGRQAGPWLGFGPSGVELSLDVGMHFRVVEGLIVESWAIFDLPRMMLPLGIDLLTGGTAPGAAPVGAPGAAPGTAPAATRDARDGLGTHPQMRASAATGVTSDGSASGTGGTPIPDENNECSTAYTMPPGGGEEPSAAFDCPAFVIRSTDATWHARDWARTSAAVDTFFSEDWLSVRAFGLTLRGRESLRSFMKDWLGGFPDVFIHVADVFCLGSMAMGYKTTMPYVLTATHSGWSKAFGAPTGRKVKYHGIANCFIKRIGDQWQYTREWDLPDMWAFLTALNLTAAQIPPHPSGDLVPVDQCKPLFELGSGEMNWFPQVAADA